MFSQDNNDAIIYWSKNKRLIWSDFKGKASPLDSTSDNVAIASTDISILYENTGRRLTFKVVSYFRKNKSWTRDTISEILLKHEQGHFDISELYARKLRKFLQNFNPKQSAQVLESGINLLTLEADAFQEKYDEETEHGKLKAKQAEWNNLINEELEQLNEYVVKNEEK
jgi:Predicted secreted Zn-dependent protease